MIRKATILGVYGGYLALVVAIVFMGGKDLMLPAIPGAIFAVAAWIGVGIFMSHKSFWRLGNAPAIELDERERNVRSGAYWFAYIVFVTLVFVGLTALTLGSDMLRVTTWHVEDLSALVWGVFLFGLTLPSAILMWTEDDETAEHEG
jgi:hypothetical protein